MEPGRRAGLLRFFAENHGKAIFDLTLRAIQEKAVLLDASDLSLRVLGRLAAEYQNTKTFELEILQLSKTVIDELIADLNSGRATGIPIPGDFAILGSRESAGDACRAFNGLPEHERTILYQIFIQKVPKARVAAQHGLDEALLASMVSGLLQQIVVRLRGPA
ncbi:MAG: hypothetical protein HY286_18510 [Planctomycetes bacterium]|nr:hypothetical protein [Planctomycetota bacterium]